MKLKLCTILLFQLTLHTCIAQKTNSSTCNDGMIISCTSEGSDGTHYFPWRINEESCEEVGMNRTLLFQTNGGNFSLIFNTDAIIKCEILSNLSDSDSGFLPFDDDAYNVIAFAVILVLCIIITCLTTFIVTCVCIRRRYKKTYAELSKSQSIQEKISYDTVTHTGTITKNDFELHPNPAYGSGSKMTMNSNPAYKTCN